MLSSDNGNILIIGFLMQGTVLNMFPCVFNVVRYNSNGILLRNMYWFTFEVVYYFGIFLIDSGSFWSDRSIAVRYV